MTVNQEAVNQKYKMITQKSVNRILNYLLLLVVVLFLMEQLTPIDISIQFLKSFVYYGLLILPIIIIIRYFLNEKQYWKTLILPITVLIFVIYFNPVQLIFSSTVWQTANVQYQHKSQENRKIEFQIRDLGALGNKRRTVEIRDFIVLSYVKLFDENILNDNWIKVLENQ